MSAEIFAELRQRAAAGDRSGALRELVARFRAERAHAELFEALKMQARHELGLPLVTWAAGEAELAGATPEQQAQLELALYRNCEEVGELLFTSGRPALAWRYFQLVGNRPKAASLLRAIAVTPDNVAEITHVAVDAGVDPVYGLKLTIQHQGLCNGITLYDRQLGLEPQTVRGPCAAVLVAALYADLVRNIRQRVETAEGGQLPADRSLAQLLTDRPWLCSGGDVHIDVSHLASVVRIATAATDRDSWERARQLCIYGQQLDPQYRGGGEMPFPEHYADHHRFFAALLGEDRPAALSAFRTSAAAAPPGSPERRAAWEVVAALELADGQPTTALAISLQELEGRAGPLGLVPTALELAVRAEALPQLAEHFAAEGNLLLYATALCLADPADLDRQQRDAARS